MCSGMSADLQNSPQLLFPILGQAHSAHKRMGQSVPIQMGAGEAAKIRKRRLDPHPLTGNKSWQGKAQSVPANSQNGL